MCNEKCKTIVDVVWTAVEMALVAGDIGSAVVRGVCAHAGRAGERGRFGARMGALAEGYGLVQRDDPAAGGAVASAEGHSERVERSDDAGSARADCAEDPHVAIRFDAGVQRRRTFADVESGRKGRAEVFRGSGGHVCRVVHQRGACVGRAGQDCAAPAASFACAECADPDSDEHAGKAEQGGVQRAERRADRNE